MASVEVSLFDALMETNETQYLDFAGHKLAYHRAGRGSPNLLFLHGWPLHRATWRDVIAHLPNATSYALDFPGCGESISPENAALSLRRSVEATVEAIKQLEADQLVLVGHDSGGLIARMTAARLPGQVEGLVLIGTEIPGHHAELIDQLQLMLRAPGAAAVTRRALASPTIARNKRMLGGCFWDRDLIEGSFRTEVLDPVLASPAALRRQIAILNSYTHDLVDELFDVHSAITCPTLLIWGEKDPFFPVEQARAMSEQFGGPTRFETVADARLLVHEEHPDRVANLIDDFLDQVG